jgi:dihydrofolate synthase/folylpolyglutamate synthase
MGQATDFTYDDAERYLRSLELFGMRFGLDRMRRLMTTLDSPQRRFDSIQVVGTNGKSSTARMAAAILERHGVRTGSYTSPHLASFAERVEIGGRQVSPEQFAAAVQRAERAAELVDRGLAAGDRVTQFEALTAAAYAQLGGSGVDAAVVEAGLGGRYDATSVIAPRVVVLTNVGLEHTRWLGPTEHHIAAEKLAVVAPGATLVAGPLGPEALAVAERVVAERQARLLLLGRDFRLEGAGRSRFAVRLGDELHDEIALRPLGSFQRVNFAVSVAASRQFLGRLDSRAVREAAAELALPGRLEEVAQDPLVLFDGAHNPDAARALRASIEQLVASRELVSVISVLDDKDAAGILTELLPLCARVVFTRSSHPRALPPATLASLCSQLTRTPAEVIPAPAPALERARELAGSAGAVLVTGSLYLLSDLTARAVRAREQTA